MCSVSSLAASCRSFSPSDEDVSVTCSLCSHVTPGVSGLLEVETLAGGQGCSRVYVVSGRQSWRWFRYATCFHATCTGQRSVKDKVKKIHTAHPETSGLSDGIHELHDNRKSQRSQHFKFYGFLLRVLKMDFS